MNYLRGKESFVETPKDPKEYAPRQAKSQIRNKNHLTNSRTLILVIFLKQTNCTNKGDYRRLEKKL